MKLKVNYSSNKVFFVEKNVIEQFVKKAVRGIETIKLISLDLQINKIDNNYSLNISIQKAKETTYKNALVKLTKKIEEYSLNILDKRPSNIMIEIENKYN